MIETTWRDRRSNWLRPTPRFSFGRAGRRNVRRTWTGVDWISRSPTRSSWSAALGRQGLL